MADEVSKPGNTESPAQPNKAQAEFEKYTKRMQGHGAMPVFMMPYPQGGNMGPGWAVPPSMMMLPRSSGGFPDASLSGSLTDSLGTGIRLGVDVINAALAGGVRILNGIAGLAGGHGHENCDCHCESCCERECGGQDCCGCDPCHPGVGTCC